MGSDPVAPTQEEETPDPAAAAASFSSSSSSSSASAYLTVLMTCIALSAAAAIAFLVFSKPSASHLAIFASFENSTARPFSKLCRSVVLLFSSYGFRFKTSLPNINRLTANGTEAETGLIPVFPTLTYPNHYSIVTGLHPSYHGIISNHFLDAQTGEAFSMQNREPKWWLGEPLWETVANHGLRAATSVRKLSKARGAVVRIHACIFIVYIELVFFIGHRKI